MVIQRFKRVIDLHKKKGSGKKQYDVLETKEKESVKRPEKTLKRSNTTEHKTGEKKYLRLVMEETGWSEEKAKQEMDVAKDQLDISYREYYKLKFYTLTRSRQERKASNHRRKRAATERVWQNLMLETGLSKADLRKNIKELNEYEIYPVTVKRYNRYGMFEMADDDVRRLLETLSQVKKSTLIVKEKLEAVDRGQLSYEDIEADINSYKQLIKGTLTKHLRQRLTSDLKIVIPNLEEDPIECERVLLDFEFCRNVLSCSPGEYKMYHLYASDLKGQREYVNDHDRETILRKLNTKELFDLVNNKYLLYQKIGAFFKRDMASITTEADFPIFCDFVKKHTSFVIKPLNDSLGRGVSLITVDLESDLQEQFDALLNDKRTFLMEERILPSDKMSVFNPDSLNTVRLIVYYDGKITKPVGSFMRTGRPGSFVDNAGAGGVFASVDYEKGVVNSCGADEKGRLYEEHPDSHIKYEGFAIPNWEEALFVGCEANKAIGFPCFVGWDLALNQQEQWVVVEGNGLPQLVHQSPLGHGVKSQLLMDLGIKQ